MKVQVERTARLPNGRDSRDSGWPFAYRSAASESGGTAAGRSGAREIRAAAGHHTAFTGRVMVRLLILIQPFIAAAVLLCAAAACATPAVFLDPGQIVVAPSEEFELSFRVDDCGDSIASYQLYLSFDHEIVELVEATEGSLYSESGFMTWFVEEEEEPGFWHFFDTAFGAGTFVAPPGELLHLRFRALPGAVGYTQAHVDTIRMTNALRDPLPVGGVTHADIFVPSTSAGEVLEPALLGPPVPNPFVHETEIPFSLPPSGSRGVVRIYSVSGRLVRRLVIPSATRRGEVEWDGRNEEGVVVAPGAYLITLGGSEGGVRTKVLKLH